MAGSSMRLCAWIEMMVVLFQVFGVLALCLHRLTPATRWGNRGRVGFVIALIGLGITGAICGQHDSAFALFAGGTMTFLLIGMTMGSEHVDGTAATRPRMAPGPRLVG
jgi:uncharacterized membrane protein YcfT